MRTWDRVRASGLGVSWHLFKHVFGRQVLLSCQGSLEHHSPSDEQIGAARGIAGHCVHRFLACTANYILYHHNALWMTLRYFASRMWHTRIGSIAGPEASTKGLGLMIVITLTSLGDALSLSASQVGPTSHGTVPRVTQISRKNWVWRVRASMST